MTIKHLTKPDFYNPHDPLSSEIMAKHFIPDDAEILDNDKWQDSGYISYLIHREFPPDALIDEMSQFYLSAGWSPLKYDLMNALEKADYFLGWEFREFVEGPHGKIKGMYRRGEQYWINEQGQAIRIILNQADLSKFGTVNVTIDLYEPSFIKEPLDFYIKLHGVEDKWNNKEIMNKIKQDGHVFFLVFLSPDGPSLNKAVIPYEKIPPEYLKLWLEK